MIWAARSPGIYSRTLKSYISFYIHLELEILWPGRVTGNALQEVDGKPFPVVRVRSVAGILVPSIVMVDPIAFVDPAAKQTLLALTAPPVSLEKEEQHAPVVLQPVSSSVQIAPSAIVGKALQSADGKPFPAVRSVAWILVPSTAMVDPIAFVDPAAKQTLLALTAPPVSLEKVEQHAPVVLQPVSSSVQIAPSAIVPVTGAGAA